MKKLLLLSLIIVVTASMIFAAVPTKFVWTIPTTNTDRTVLTDLGGYKLYCGITSGSYVIIKNVGMATPKSATEVSTLIASVVTPFVEGTTYYCVVTAYDTQLNESGFSNEVNFTAPRTVPVAPISLGVE